MKKNYLNIITRILAILTAIPFGFIIFLSLFNILQPTYESMFNAFFFFITGISIFIFALSIYHLYTGKYTKLFISMFIIAGLTIFLARNNYIGNQPFIHPISMNIKMQLEVNNGNKVDLSTVIESKFERVCIFGPYSHNEGTRNILGFDWDIEQKTSIHLNDGYNVLVFIANNQVVDYVKHPRNIGDFSSFSGKCFTQFNAKFERENIRKGLRHLDVYFPNK